MTNPKGFRHFTDKVTPVLGGTVGNGVSFLLASLNPEVGGVVGPLLAPGIAALIAGVGNELSSRVLGPRGDYRVGKVFVFAVEEIQRRIQNGESPRSDGFFTADIGGGRTVADEVWESALMKSARESQEKKLVYMAHLLAGLAFSSDIGEGEAHQLLHLAEELTYQKLCILVAFSVRNEHLPTVKDCDHSFLNSIMFDLVELSKRDYFSTVAHSLGNPSILAEPRMVCGIAGRLYSLMQLETIPVEDIEPIKGVLGFVIENHGNQR